ncbi:LCP family protein [Natribacillus halophilus]|uniref:Cell envelope-related function transcriptional attenuator common domain-containing protein n=1 Tax=Natribacillus halophilus TaxID=549003 RepID=A0A1G8KGP3_9BACI|nr:LCP family protein [Natribacillus halophilus]SDI42565.1 cell envelope-related function transcriptional attenuator common domain-containing protein [Natribacillus halophilus]
MKKALIILAIVVSALILLVGGYALYLYVSFSSTADDMHTHIERDSSDFRSDDINFAARDPVSFLLLGLDSDRVDLGRADTMIVATVNPGDQSMKMVSIPRDTNTELVGRGWNDKINHAYYYGGEEMAIDTVEHFLDIPIDYIVTIDMDGFEEMVDAVGGITVDNRLDFEYGGFAFEQGELELSGEEALAYVRMRQDDPLGDSGRNERQQQVIEGVLREGANLTSVTSVGSILDAIGSNIQTNMGFQEMIDMHRYESSRHDLEQLSLSGEHSQLDGVYYYVVDEVEKERVTNTLREHLELEE